MCLSGDNKLPNEYVQSYSIIATTGAAAVAAMKKRLTRRNPRARKGATRNTALKKGRVASISIVVQRAPATLFPQLVKLLRARGPTER